jgi:hypothetical protein
VAERVLRRAGRHRAPVTGTPAAVRGWLLKITRGVVLNDAPERRIPATNGTATRDGELAMGDSASGPAKHPIAGQPGDGASGTAENANQPATAGEAADRAGSRAGNANRPAVAGGTGVSAGIAAKQANRPAVVGLPRRNARA